MLVVEVAEFQQAGDDAFDDLGFNPAFFQQAFAQLSDAARFGRQQPERAGERFFVGRLLHTRIVKRRRQGVKRSRAGRVSAKQAASRSR